jgi:hypothetical protein
VTERLNNRCVELTGRITALEEENKVLIQRLSMPSQKDDTEQKQTDSIEGHVGNGEMEQVVSDAAAHATFAFASGLPDASTEPGAGFNVLENINLDAVDAQCAEKGDR